MPPMPANAGIPHGHAPSTFDKLKNGAMMGGSVGLIMGFGFGLVNIMRFGAGPDGPMRMLGKYMLGSSTTFGFFMSIGSVIRTEGNSPVTQQAFMQAGRPMLVQRVRPTWRS